MIDKKKKIEKDAVIHFLKNAKIVSDNSKMNLSQDEPVDVFCEDINMRFQVVTAPFAYQEVWGRLDKEDKIESKQNKNIKGENIVINGRKQPSVNGGYSTKEMWRDLIVSPIAAKKKHYSPESVKDVILLIYNRDIPDKALVFLEQWLLRAKKDHDNVKYLESSGFKEIYLVNFEKNIKIY